MEILLRRIARKPAYTIGKLYINGKYFCDTIEDKDRGLKQSMPLSEIKKIKVYAQTAIPTGTYTVTMNVISPKFSLKTFYKNFCKGRMPRVLNVPGYEGILIHCGYNQNSSAGCIIVGKNTHIGCVTDSQNTFKKLYAELDKANNNKEKITLTIL